MCQKCWEPADCYTLTGIRLCKPCMVERYEYSKSTGKGVLDYYSRSKEWDKQNVVTPEIKDNDR